MKPDRPDAETQERQNDFSLDETHDVERHPHQHDVADVRQDVHKHA